MTSFSSTNFTLNGRVIDAITGDPLPGTTILVKETGQGTVSGVDGTFSIANVQEGQTTLFFSFIGYITREVVVNGRDFLIVPMEEENMALEETVVTGYNIDRIRDIANAVTGINVADMPGQPEVGSQKNLQERVSGIAVKSTYGYSSPYHQPVPRYNTEGYSTIHENGFKSPVKEPLSTFSIDVDAASYSNVRRFITQGQRPVKDAVRIEEMINYFDYDYPQPDNGHPFSIVYELGECPWNRDNLLLHIGLQGERMDQSEVPPSNLVFLIDVSGSMDSPNKLPLLKNAMKLLVGQLRASDRVAIVVYAGSSGLVLPSTRGDQKARIMNALERLHAGGSTAGAAGLKLAYEIAERNLIEDGNNRIILATDGDFNVGPSSNAEMERMIEKYRDRGIFISVAGFGMGNYKDDKMEIIADKGNGNYSYIDNLMEAKKVFVNEFSSTLYTIAKDVKIQIEFNPAYVKEYRLVGYENRLLDEEDFDDDQKDAGEMGAGHTVTALYEIIPADGNGRQTRRLRYQETETTKDFSENNELATIQLRYKKPDKDRSILITEIIFSQVTGLDETSDNFRFSASVAGFGMLLRDSEYLRTWNANHIISMARSSKGLDEDGYRSEFIRLVELSENIMASGYGFRDDFFE